jgi:hypothetical protein
LALKLNFGFPETEMIPHIKIGEAPKITLQTLALRCIKYGNLGCVLATVDDHQNLWSL